MVRYNITKDIHVDIEGEVVLDCYTDFQHVQITRNNDLGLILLLDGIPQSCSIDERAYHEYLVQPALISHENPGSILIIGGGNGRALEEVLRDSTKEVTLVELDKEMIEISINYGNFNPSIYKDLKLIHMDGRKFLQKTDAKYDLIFFDITDPGTMASSLYSIEAYELVVDHLKEGGIFTTIADSTHYGPLYSRIARTFNKMFSHVCSYDAFFPSSFMPLSFIMGSKSEIIPSKKLFNERVHGKDLSMDKEVLYSKYLYPLPYDFNAEIITDNSPAMAITTLINN